MLFLDSIAPDCLDSGQPEPGLSKILTRRVSKGILVAPHLRFGFRFSPGIFTGDTFEKAFLTDQPEPVQLNLRQTVAFDARSARSIGKSAIKPNPSLGLGCQKP